MKTILTLLLSIAVTTSIAQTFNVGGGINKSDNSSDVVVYKVRNDGTADAGLLFVKGNDSTYFSFNGDTTGIYGSVFSPDTIVSDYAFINGNFKAVDGDSAFFDLGMTEIDVFGGAVTVRFYGAISKKRVGDWWFLSSTATNSVSDAISADLTAINTVSGEFYSTSVDSTSSGIISGNLLNDVADFNGVIVKDSGIFVFLSKNNYSAYNLIRDGGSILSVDSLGNMKLGAGGGFADTTLHVAGKFKYDDGLQSNGYVLTSDANGVATWGDIKDVDASSIPKYAGNAAATAAIGAGKLYIDTSDGNAVKVSE